MRNERRCTGTKLGRRLAKAWSERRRNRSKSRSRSRDRRFGSLGGIAEIDYLTSDEVVFAHDDVASHTQSRG